MKKTLYLSILIFSLSCGDEEEQNKFGAPNSWDLRPLIGCKIDDKNIIRCLYADDECRYQVVKEKGEWVQESFSC